jgi:hypothetical protein
MRTAPKVRDVIPNRAESPVRNLLFSCHPEEAESRAKRATPDEGPMQLACCSTPPHVWDGHFCPSVLMLILTLTLVLPGKGTA